MRRSILALIIVLSVLLGSTPSLAQGEEKLNIDQLYDQSLNMSSRDFLFQVDHTLDRKKKKIHIFKLYGSDLSGNTGHTLRYFLDGKIKGVFPGLSMPHIFKRNFAGLKRGQHEVVLELRDEEGRVSTWSDVILVE